MAAQTVSRYKAVEKLGGGGVGEVYKAQDLTQERIVALKIVPKSSLGSEGDQARFVRETRAAAAIDHPNICTVHEVVEMDEYALVSMAFIGGRSLEDIIRAGPLDPIKAVDYAIQVAEGLQVAHANQVVHRGIKSSNIMVSAVGGIRITDFGVGVLPNRARITPAEGKAGPVAYMSPEQIQSKDVDHQTDIWSLGVVLYEMVAGRLPFRGDPGVVANKILREDAPALRSLNPDVPESLERVVSRAMAKNWEERYANTAELLDDLRGVPAAAEAEASQAAAAAEVAELAAMADEAEPVPTVVRRFLDPKSRRTWIGAAAFVAIVAAIILLTRPPRMPFAERDWVVISDFSNVTGEALFDKSLDMALLVTLEQSPYVNAIPRRRSEDALRRMKKKDIEYIHEEIAREIAVLEGLRVVVVPAIRQSGDGYTLTSVIRNAETGQELRSDMVKADAQGDILGALDELAAKIRARLGEGSPSIARTSEPLEKITTSSLAGLRQYALGYEKEQRGQLEEAKRHYEYSLESDSVFAMATGALGVLEYYHFDRFKGMDYLNAAVDMTEETTEPQAAAIRAAHAIAVEGSYEKAAQYYRKALHEYPDVASLHNELGAVYAALGRHQDAAEQYEEAIRAEPTLMVAYDRLTREYLVYLGRVDLALEWSRRQMVYEPESPRPYANLAYAYIGADSLERAAAVLDQGLAYDADFGPGQELLGHVLCLEKRYDESLAAFARALKADPEAVENNYYMGAVHRSRRKNANARDYFERFRKVSQWRTEDNPGDARYLFDLAVAQTRLGQTSRGRATGEKALAIDSTAYYDLARLAAVQGRTDDAFDLLERSAKAGFRDFIVVKYHPDFEKLRNTPRLTQLLDTYLQM